MIERVVVVIKFQCCNGQKFLHWILTRKCIIYCSLGCLFFVNSTKNIIDECGTYIYFMRGYFLIVIAIYIGTFISESSRGSFLFEITKSINFGTLKKSRMKNKVSNHANSRHSSYIHIDYLFYSRNLVKLTTYIIENFCEWRYFLL